MFVDLYAALDLDKTASASAIKKAYRTLALRWHPDKNPGDAEAQVKFQAIGKAYAVLNDAKKKQYYDSTGDLEDIDVSASDFVDTFVVMMGEMLGSRSIEEMLDGLGAADLKSMPPFPFPALLFSPGTFPDGMRFAEDFHVPPSVTELIESQGTEALQKLVEQAQEKVKSRGGGRFDGDTSDDSSEWESASDEGGRDARRAGSRGGRAGPRDPRGNYPWDAFASMNLDCDDDDDIDDDELMEMMKSMPPEMFQQFLEQDAGKGGESGEEAAKLLEMLAEMKGTGDVGNRDDFSLPPELERLLGSARGDGPSVSGGRGGGGGGGHGPAHQRNACQNKYRRGKNGGGRGGEKETRGAGRKTLRNGGDGFSNGSNSASECASPATRTSSESPGPNRDKNRRKKLRKKQQKEGGQSGVGDTTVGDTVLNGDSVFSHETIAWSPVRSFASETSNASTLDRQIVKQWIDSAKSGNLGTLKQLFSKHPSLLHAKSPGIGHTALHWSCSKGLDLLQVIEWLLSREINADPNCLNNEGATALHAASGVGCLEVLRILSQHGVDPSIRDEAGERASDVAARRGHLSFVHACREGEKLSPSLADGNGTSPVPESTSEVKPGTSARSEHCKEATSLVVPKATAEPSDSESSDDETAKTQKLAHMSAKAKKKGNAAFAAGDFQKAVKQFTMSIRMDKSNYVLFSNRSGAYCGCGRYEEALADAERCLRLAPKWGKGYGRKGAALTGLGQGGEAVKAYLAGLAVEPDIEGLRAGLAEAKAAIRDAQERYKEMWGKDAPGGGVNEETADSVPVPPALAPPKASTSGQSTSTTETSNGSRPTDPTPAKRSSGLTPEILNATLSVNALDKEVCKKWLSAAKAGDLKTLQNMFAADNNLLYVWGKGTSLGFTGNSAMHWCASKGHVSCVRWLLQMGLHPDTQNNNDSTPSHSAAGAGEAEVLRCLLMEGGGDGQAADGLGETPRAVGIAMGNRRGGNGGDLIAAVVDLGVRVGKLRKSISETQNTSSTQMDLKTCREVLQLSGVDTRGFSERREFIEATETYLASLRPRITPPGGKWVVGPSLVGVDAAEETVKSDGANVGSECSGVSAAETVPVAAPEAVADVSKATVKDEPNDSDSSDDESSKSAKLAHMSAEAKKKGNTAFAAGEFPKAVKQFTMAIRMDKTNNVTNHVLFSNRSAAHLGCGKYEDALADAERCVRMAPKWGKGYGRKGAALTGLGQGGEAVKAYLAGLAVEPENEGLRAGLSEAKAAIRVAQDRYKEMWGKDAPGGGEED